MTPDPVTALWHVLWAALASPMPTGAVLLGGAALAFTLHVIGHAVRTLMARGHELDDIDTTLVHVLGDTLHLLDDAGVRLHQRPRAAAFLAEYRAHLAEHGADTGGDQ